MDISLGLEGTHIVVTGAAGHIGTAIIHAFLAAGCRVSAFDIKAPTTEFRHEHLTWHLVDITDESAIQDAFDAACKSHGPPATCVAAAGLDISYLPHHSSLCDMELAQWQRTNKVNGEGTFLTARAWLRCIRAQQQQQQAQANASNSDSNRSLLRNVSLIIIGSEAGVFGVSGNADYAASKAGIQYGLVRSLMRDVVGVHPRARVNAIAPGAVHTSQFEKECAADAGMMWVEAQATVALRRAVSMEGVARCCLFLASERWSGSVTGQVISVDGGKMGRLFWGEDGRAM